MSENQPDSTLRSTEMHREDCTDPPPPCVHTTERSSLSLSLSLSLTDDRAVPSSLPTWS